MSNLHFQNQFPINSMIKQILFQVSIGSQLKLEPSSYSQIPKSLAGRPKFDLILKLMIK